MKGVKNGGPPGWVCGNGDQDWALVWTLTGGRGALLVAAIAVVNYAGNRKHGDYFNPDQQLRCQVEALLQSKPYFYTMQSGKRIRLVVPAPGALDSDGPRRYSAATTVPQEVGQAGRDPGRGQGTRVSNHFRTTGTIWT
jgi:hypothetical protein